MDMRSSLEGRLFLRVLSAVLLIAGAVLVMAGFTATSAWMDTQLAPGQPLDRPPFALALFGFALLGVGAALTRLAFLRPAFGLIATEMGAVEAVARAAGRGKVGRVRCRACGHLETDVARFCSSCAEAV